MSDLAELLTEEEKEELLGHLQAAIDLLGEVEERELD
jgi:hypothetical protein